MLSPTVIQAVKQLGGIISDNFRPEESDVTPSELQHFSSIQWNENSSFKAPKYSLYNVSFESVEYSILDKTIWRDNSWIQEHNMLYLIGHSNLILATLEADDMSDFSVYMIELKGVKGPVQLSKLLKNCVPEGQTTYQLEHGEELFFGLDWNDYFTQNDPIPSVQGKKSQEVVWYSGKAPKLMQFYQDNYRRQTVSWIGKKMEKIFKGISYSTLIRFVTNIVDDLSAQQKSRIRK